MQEEHKPDLRIRVTNQEGVEIGVIEDADYLNSLRTILSLAIGEAVLSLSDLILKMELDEQVPAPQTDVLLSEITMSFYQVVFTGREIELTPPAVVANAVAEICDTLTERLRPFLFQVVPMVAETHIVFAVRTLEAPEEEEEEDVGTMERGQDAELPDVK